MGCLNSEGQFNHWFGNIHLSGPCNRKCYFCIGQHMMALDSYNNLDKWPLDGMSQFLEECEEHNIEAINLTGTNTDPLLYKHIPELSEFVGPNYRLGIRTNGVANLELLEYFDHGSISICSFDEEIYQKMMGVGKPPDMEKILKHTEHWDNLKVNIILGPEIVKAPFDIDRTIGYLRQLEIPKINLREPYGQPHVGNPIEGITTPDEYVMGMPTYHLKTNGKITTKLTYWDVHYVEVESVNLYANGRVSLTYPITKGHDDMGIVLDQTHFTGGRVREQWLR